MLIWLLLETTYMYSLSSRQTCQHHTRFGNTWTSSDELHYGYLIRVLIPILPALRCTSLVYMELSSSDSSFLRQKSLKKTSDSTPQMSLLSWFGMAFCTAWISLSMVKVIGSLICYMWVALKAHIRLTHVCTPLEDWKRWQIPQTWEAHWDLCVPQNYQVHLKLLDDLFWYWKWIPNTTVRHAHMECNWFVAGL